MSILLSGESFNSICKALKDTKESIYKSIEAILLEGKKAELCDGCQQLLTQKTLFHDCKDLQQCDKTGHRCIFFDKFDMWSNQHQLEAESSLDVLIDNLPILVSNKQDEEVSSLMIDMKQYFKSLMSLRPPFKPQLTEKINTVLKVLKQIEDKPQQKTISEEEKDRMKYYFKPNFKGIGNNADDDQSGFDRFIEDLMTKCPTAKDKATLLALAFESESVIKKNLPSFAQWLRNWSDVVGQKLDTYKQSQLNTDRIANTFYYLKSSKK